MPRTKTQNCPASFFVKPLFLGMIFLFLSVLPALAQNLLYEDFQGAIYNPPQTAMYAPFYHPGATETGFNDTTIFPPGTTQSLGLNITFTAPFTQPLANGVAQIVVASQYAPGANNAGTGSVEPFNALIGGSAPAAISLELYASTTTSFYLFLGDVNNTCSCGPGHTGGSEETEILNPVTIPAGIWTNVTVPLNSTYWDSNLSFVNFSEITQVFIDAIAPPCSAALPGGALSETTHYGPISFLGSITNPTPTPANTPVYSCPTNTATPTATATFTATSTPTITRTPTITLTPTITYTPMPTATFPSNVDDFYVSKNVFNPSQGSVSIFVEYTQYPGNYSLQIYNSAGELIKNLDKRVLSQPVSQSYLWDGTNQEKAKCASGVYILYLIEPFGKKLKRVLLIH